MQLSRTDWISGVIFSLGMREITVGGHLKKMPQIQKKCMNMWGQKGSALPGVYHTQISHAEMASSPNLRLH